MLTLLHTGKSYLRVSCNQFCLSFGGYYCRDAWFLLELQRPYCPVQCVCVSHILCDKSIVELFTSYIHSITYIYDGLKVEITTLSVHNRLYILPLSFTSPFIDTR